ncbi:sensor histidine kinase [Anaerosporobacter faecicola]|uniref:sensor histidine kinase n=1 Tax=Anaerosporobacter faecicola TaxID=2718714 RepID=UPI001438915A|nr:histidine kinase [Anaerosporobacter faecicola]
MKSIQIEDQYHQYIEIPLLLLSCLLIIISPLQTHTSLSLYLLLLGAYMLFRYYFLFAAVSFLSTLIVGGLLLFSYIALCFTTPTWYLPLLSFFTSYVYFSRKSRWDWNVFLWTALFTITFQQILWFCNPDTYTLEEHLKNTLLSIVVQIALLIGLYYILHHIKQSIYMQSLIKDLSLHSMKEQNLIKQLAISKDVIEQNARLEEREAISRTIHNSVGHTITASILALDAADLLWDVAPDKAREKYKIAGTRMHDSLAAIRRGVRILTEDNGTISMEDFYHTLSETIQEFVLTSSLKVRHNIQADYITMPQLMIPATYVEFLNGAILESFSNGVRHGGATAFIVILTVIPSPITSLDLLIEDNGSPCSPSTWNSDNLEGGFGIAKMRSFVQKHGGTFKTDQEEGYSTHLKLPVLPDTTAILDNMNP